MLKKILLLILGLEVLDIVVSWLVFRHVTHNWQTCHTAVVGCGESSVVSRMVDVALAAGGLFVFTLPATIIVWLWGLRAKR